MLLARYFLARFNREFARNIRGFTEGAMTAISCHSWPGNVRELENRMKRAVVMTETRLIDAADLELAVSGEAAHDLDLRAARLRAERDVLEKALTRSNGTLAAAAKLLGISRPTLYTLMEAHGLELAAVPGLDPGSDAKAAQSDAVATEDEVPERGREPAPPSTVR